MVDDATQANALIDFLGRDAVTSRSVPRTAAVNPAADEFDLADDDELGLTDDDDFGAAPSKPKATAAGSSGTRTPPAGEPVAPQADEEQETLRGATALRECMASAYLATVVQPGSDKPFSPCALQTFRSEYLKRCGVADDPVEIGLIETFMLVQHVVGKLCGVASDVRNVRAIEATCGAATKFVGELRRLAIAIQSYRASRQTVSAAANNEPSEPARHGQPDATVQHNSGARTCGAKNSCSDTDVSSNSASNPNPRSGSNGRTSKAVA